MMIYSVAVVRTVPELCFPAIYVHVQGAQMFVKSIVLFGCSFGQLHDRNEDKGATSREELNLRIEKIIQDTHKLISIET